MGRTIEQQLSELYLANLDAIGEGLPGAVNAARRGFLETLTLEGIPSTNDERYRHTDLRALFRGDWEVRFGPAGDRTTAPPLAAEGYRIRVDNGFTDGTLTVLDNGIVYGSLRQALRQIPEAAAHYNTVADNDTQVVTALSSLFMQDGAFVYVPDHVKADKPFLLDYIYDAQDASLLCFPRTLIVMGAGASADAFVTHSGNGRVLANYVREVVLGENAELGLGGVSMLADDGTLIAGQYLSQAASSRTHMAEVWLRGGAVRINAVTDLRGRDAESDLKGLYFATETKRVDIHMTVNHLVSDCRSAELVKGIVSGEAVGAFTGKVYVARDAQRTSAMQQSRNLQMSDSARIYTEPQLEIYADDVKCSHGATVGQMDDDMILYMRQRGISEEDAKRLRLFGFVNDVVAACRIPDICGAVERLAGERIGEL